jgi:hypothetical protein
VQRKILWLSPIENVRSISHTVQGFFFKKNLAIPSKHELNFTVDFALEKADSFGGTRGTYTE